MMSRSKKESTGGRLGTALGALTFASIGAAVVLVPKVRKAVVGAAGMAYDAIQERCVPGDAPDEKASKESASGKTEEPEERISPVGTEARRPADRAAPAEPVRPKAGHRRIAEEQAAKTSPKTVTKAKRKPSRKGGTTKTTSPGYVNANDQEVIRRVGKSESWKNQYVYELECGECGHRYGAHGPEIKSRLCPECQDGAAGEPI